VADDTALLRIEKINGACSAVGNQDHAMGKSQLVESGTPRQIEHANLAQRRLRSSGQQQGHS
jgi:hypothetical protein